MFQVWQGAHILKLGTKHGLIHLWKQMTLTFMWNVVGGTNGRKEDPLGGLIQREGDGLEVGHDSRDREAEG